MTSGNYHGSKYRIGNEMTNFILDYVEDEEYTEIIDCFCGSGSVSIQFRKNPPNLL
jgi:hypothetical protein